MKGIQTKRTSKFLPRAALPPQRFWRGGGAGTRFFTWTMAAGLALTCCLASGMGSNVRNIGSIGNIGSVGAAEAADTVAAAEVVAGEKPVLDPEKYFGKAKAGYMAAKACPEICAKLFCYCGCDLTDEHNSLLDCFTSDHGVDCYICQEEALVALKMKEQGKGLAEIQKVVDLAYTKEYPWDENSPAYKKYLAAKLWQGSARAELDKARSQGSASSAKDKTGPESAVGNKNAKQNVSNDKSSAGKFKTPPTASAAEAAKRATKGSCCGGHAQVK